MNTIVVIVAVLAYLVLFLAVIGVRVRRSR